MINTHFHADFLAGHLELADATGAWIGYGRLAETEYPIRHLADGERIVLGDVVLEIIETPGHTPESISIQVFTQSLLANGFMPLVDLSAAAAAWCVLRPSAGGAVPQCTGGPTAVS